MKDRNVKVLGYASIARDPSRDTGEQIFHQRDYIDRWALQRGWVNVWPSIGDEYGNEGK